MERDVKEVEEVWIGGKGNRKGITGKCQGGGQVWVGEGLGRG